MPDVFIVKYEV